MEYWGFATTWREQLSMSPKRIGPLFLLVMAGLLLAATWTTASADERRVQILSPDPVARMDVPVFTPHSGEPDVGGTPAPRSKSNDRSISVRAVNPSPWSPLPPWARWIMRTWRVWFPGLS